MPINNLAALAMLLLATCNGIALGVLYREPILARSKRLRRLAYREETP